MPAWNALDAIGYFIHSMYGTSVNGSTKRSTTRNEAGGNKQKASKINMHEYYVFIKQ